MPAGTCGTSARPGRCSRTMHRLLPVLLALAALVVPATASAAESFLGVLADGRAVRFTDETQPAVSAPRRIDGVEAGDRLVAVSEAAALGRTGRIYRFDPTALRATPTPARVTLTGASFSVVPAGADVRVLSSAGQDVLADPATGRVTPGPGLRTADGTRIGPSVDVLPDGRLTGLEPVRRTAVTETAPGSAVMAETPLSTRGPLPLAAPVAFALAGERGFALSALGSSRLPQSVLLALDRASGRVEGDAGPFFFRRLVALLPRGTVAEDAAAPRTRFAGVPRTVSLRDLRVNRRVRVAVRCSEGCIVNAGTAVGGRTNIVTSGSRDTAGVVRLRLFSLSLRELRLLRPRVGRTIIVRAFVQDWNHNQRIIERRVRLTR